MSEYTTPGATEATVPGGQDGPDPNIGIQGDTNDTTMAEVNPGPYNEETFTPQDVTSYVASSDPLGGPGNQPYNPTRGEGEQAYGYDGQP